MISKLTIIDSTIHVRAQTNSLKVTKNFTHGGVKFDRKTGLVTFGSLPAVHFPASIPLHDGETLNFQLVAPDGTLKKQRRVGILRKVRDADIYRIAGISKTPGCFTIDDGWQIEVFKFRAYFTHPGLVTTGSPPEWLRKSIKRQRDFWNRLAWVCREARRKCFPVSSDEIKEFVNETILPEIDALNNTLGRSNQKIKHPEKLKVDMPGADGLWKFVGELRKRIENGKPVPNGLVDQIVSFAEHFKANYTAINEFESNISEIGEEEAQKLGLLRHEIRPVLSSFKSVLKNRRTRKLAWSEGWPLIKYSDSPDAKNWSLSYYLNRAGVKASDIETAKSVPGLHFGHPKEASATGHPNMTGCAAERLLREASIRIPNRNKELWEFRFGVLQHRPIPEDSHIKQWQLSEIDGKLWLNLTLEVKREAPAASTENAAGVDIGWRRTEEGVRIGVLYEPVDGTYKEVILDFQRSPRDHSERVPFRVNLGPTRWEKRNINRLIPEWKEGDRMPGTVELRAILGKRRSNLKDHAKALLRKHLGDAVPAWFDKAGKKGLLHLAEEFKHDSTVNQIVTDFITKDRALNTLVSDYMERSTLRLEYGYQQIAHDICKYVDSKGVTCIVVEEGFLSRVSQQEPDPEIDGYYALKNSQKYRQFSAVGKFVAILKMIARKQAISIKEVPASDTTRICHECGYLNPAKAKQRYQCHGCQRLIDQDYNASANLSETASGPVEPQKAA
jgi:hypothetical protein